MTTYEKELIEIRRGEFFKSVSNSEREFQLRLIESGSLKTSITHEKGSLFYFLQTGRTEVRAKNFSVHLSAGMYMGLQDEASIDISPESTAICINVVNLSVLNTFGGPVEKTGRLKYIDGCSDSLLISPSKLGEPCLNLLHFPQNTKQTIHHHPSFRFGMVLSGKGYCINDEVTKELAAGDVFYIPPFIKHSFNTEDSFLNIVAFHPDSDWGPTDEVHPMINKTII